MQVNNNQLGSQKSFGMAFHKPNPRGMTPHAIKVIAQAQPELEKLAKDVRLDVVLCAYNNLYTEVIVSGLNRPLMRRVKDFFTKPIVVTQKVFLFEFDPVAESRNKLSAAATEAKEAYLNHPKVLAAEEAQKKKLVKARVKEKRANDLKEALIELDAAFPPKARRFRFGKSLFRNNEAIKAGESVLQTPGTPPHPAPPAPPRPASVASSD